MGGNLLMFAAGLPAILVALSLHEFGHAAMATKMGDPTPRLQGRLTLNPLAHLDPMGTLFIIFTLFAGFGFGWGKPVQTNPSYYRDYHLGTILVSAAGPAMNLAQAMIGIALGYILYKGGMSNTSFIAFFVSIFILINITLMVFNLLPIPPLDGGHITERLLPWHMREGYRRFAPYGILLLLALMWLGLLGPIIWFFHTLTAFLISLGFGPDYVAWLGI